MSQTSVPVPVPVPAAYFVRTISQELLKIDTSNLVHISIGISSCASRGYFVNLTFDLETVKVKVKKLSYFVRTISQELLKIDTSNLVHISIEVSSCASRGYFVNLTFDLETVKVKVKNFFFSDHM